MTSLQIHRRKSIRLKNFDYSTSGLYFVTICTHNKVSLFGAVRGARVELSRAGRVVQETWNALPSRFPSVGLDEFVIMPNHVHGILVFNRAPNPEGAASRAPTNSKPDLGQVICAFKSLSAIAVKSFLKRSGKPVWQRNYFEHIIGRGENLDAIRRYILENPLQWSFDLENPASRKGHSPTNLALLDWLP
jgi:putative transposase